MDGVSEAEKQLLISMFKAQGIPARATLAAPEGYFGTAVVDWSDSWAAVEARGWVIEDDKGMALTSQGEALAKQLVEAFPPDYYWYERYYTAAPHSPAYADFCLRLFGLNGCQHGFSDMTQVDRLMAEAGMTTVDRVLELGCGTGQIAEYMAGRTGAHVTGIDFSPSAIQMAQARTSRNQGLDFRVANMSRLAFPAASIDVVVAIDTLYFTDLTATVAHIAELLTPGGRLATYYSHSWEPWKPKASFDPRTLPPERTPLGKALSHAGLSWQSWDVTEQDRAHARRKRVLMEELRPRLEAEGNRFLYDNRHGEAKGVSKAIAAGLHRRYLYVACKTGGSSARA